MISSSLLLESVKHLLISVSLDRATEQPTNAYKYRKMGNRYDIIKVQETQKAAFWGVGMYRKANRNQLSLNEFYLPFGGRLSADNRWVKLSRFMPWEMIEDIYAEKFKNARSNGSMAISARIAFGALHIQADKTLTDAAMVEEISENPYLQYFLGLHEFRTEPMFD